MPRAVRFYDPIAHSYTVDGEPWLSVTQVLARAGRINARNFTPEAAERGRQVHRFCELVDVSAFAASRGKTSLQLTADTQMAKWLDTHVALAPFARAYLAFAQEYRPEYAAIEKARWSHRLRLAGRPDRIFRRLRHVHGNGILEIKTGARAPWHALQTVGYQMLRAIGSRWLFYLDEIGRYKFVRCTLASDYVEFKADLADVQHAQRFAV
jgi:hypothetical protein